MKTELVFPIMLIVLMVSSSIGYAFKGDWQMFIYWACCAIMNGVMTFR